MATHAVLNHPPPIQRSNRAAVLLTACCGVFRQGGATSPLVMGAAFDHTESYRAMLVVSLALALTSAMLFGALPGYRISESAAQEGRAA